MEGAVTLDYGSGGKKTSELISGMILPLISDRGAEPDEALCDGAVLDIPAAGSRKQGDSVQAAGQMVFSTDSFVVSPYIFAGGDIGKLAVCGTVNDISMMGARPAYLSLSFIIEEGMKFSELETITASIGRTAAQAGVRIVTGDTKVIEKGSGDGIYINTAGIGFFDEELPAGYRLRPENIRPGDSIIISGNIGDHGTAVMLARSPELGILAAEVTSDCAPLNEEALALFRELGRDLRCMRDPTRGGLGTTLNEFTEDRDDIGIELDEQKIPVSAGVRTVCDMLGLDPMYCACEGRLIAVTAPERAEDAVRLLKTMPHGKDAAVIGTVTGTPGSVRPGHVVLRTPIGTSRIITKLTGPQLPRIC